MLLLLAATPADSAPADAQYTGTGDPRPDEVSYFGESVSSLNQWPRSLAWGIYSAIDKYRPSPGRHVSDVASATVGLQPAKNFGIRFLWHRIVTDYNRDTDVVLWGLAYHF
jgi:hypothetical protein